MSSRNENNRKPTSDRPEISKIRPCLMCSGKFESNHVGQRICLRCKGTSAWREGLKVPMKQPKKGRLWLNDGSCIRLRPEYRDHVWSYDFVHHRTDDGKVFRTLNILDEHSRECLAIKVERKLNSTDVINVLTDLFILRGVPAFIRSDNGPEFVAETVRNWIKLRVQIRPTSSQDHPGRTDTVKASMLVSGSGC